jgi:DNA invertase Pin-like site-specific DNA recombinase
MGVNIWVTNDNDGEQIPVCWGPNMVAYTRSDGKRAITTTNGKSDVLIRETPAEVMALVAAAERKQARERIAAQVIAAVGSGKQISQDTLSGAANYAISVADALLDALAAREGAE